jgi:hypothetical protein
MAALDNATDDISVSSKVMAGFFDGRVNEIVEMFEEHYEDARTRKKKKVKVRMEEMHQFSRLT